MANKRGSAAGASQPNDHTAAQKERELLRIEVPELDGQPDIDELLNLLAAIGARHLVERQAAGPDQQTDSAKL